MSYNPSMPGGTPRRNRPIFCDRFDQQRYDFLRSCLPDPPASMVELCSQDGSTVARMLGEGYDAFGVELEQEFVQLAREQFPLLGHHLIHGEMLEVFDLVRSPLALACCCGNKLPRLENEEEVASVILQLRDLAWPGGMVVIDFFNVNRLLGTVSRDSARIEKYLTPTMRKVWELTEDSNRPLEETMEIKMGGRYYRRQHRLLRINRRHIEELLPEGIMPEFFGDYDGSPWREYSPLTIVRFRCA